MVGAIPSLALDWLVWTFNEGTTRSNEGGIVTIVVGLIYGAFQML